MSNAKKHVAPLAVIPVPAAVVLNLTQFNPLTSGKFCVVGGGATDAAPLTISNTGLNANGKELIKYPTAPASQNGIVILKKNAEITFSLNNTSNTLCSMAGLAINGLPSNNVGNPDPSGGTNFKVTAWNQTTINLKAIGANANSAWKLFVAVIDGAGNLGIIDPQIENDANIG